ncbi:U3 small nucleolar RNA-associated protein 6-domain-containing protein [Suillus discolor]|uniref:U3 small nucleolar RNA-associated protein 6-domain-containing protein n=1 Tax=Suillus discolor TaxID=1912936 RepID=A0A9P7F9G7_9AGAM|nr:U3 small nucleolar RNA-associated protein 6-domain-containing protein [Suillus discolor]KAG2111315.1 U3 small nucleolar RNA-associated protein 6-domain-containing protein [Suillus discolor]
MERVQFQQEQMLAELKDLVQKSLFNQSEVKQIVKKRTQFETALVRRIPKKSDFLRYAAYEMNLEQLRRKRVERLKLEKTAPSISDYALVRRQFQIFERALKKFKSDVGLWIQYIQVAKREGARSLVGRITARAIQLHPRTPALYIIAASHELNHMSPSAARALLQRGLRLNADSLDMWREYVRMELGFVEGMKRRWTVLGIHEEDHPIVEAETTAVEDMATLTPEEIAAEKGGDEGERARQAIMDGAIVKSVILSAAKALPSINLFTALEVLIRSYPSQERLRTALLDHLYSVLKDTLQGDPHAVKMLATRKLRELTSQENSDDFVMAESEEFVDALQAANESFSLAVGAGSTNASGMADVYVEFVEEWCKLPTLDPNLRAYLVASLRKLARQPNAPPSLQAAHVQLTLPSKKAL